MKKLLVSMALSSLAITMIASNTIAQQSPANTDPVLSKKPRPSISNPISQKIITAN